MSVDLQTSVGKINSQENALIILLSDTAFVHQLKGTMENVKLASSNLVENMEELKHNFLFRGYFKRQKKAADRKKKLYLIWL